MLNNRGGFSIIAALLVAIILVASVTATYAAIRYNPVQGQPQILSAIDETNLALKQILCFTVGYYGSVMQVTGNSSYAQTLATKYLTSGLDNIANIKPEWGASFSVGSLSLGTNWFTNKSNSQANINVTYDLAGLGISGIVYSASCRLEVQINPVSSGNQISVTVLKDEGTPLVGLSTSNFKFYFYQYSDSTWATVNPPHEPSSSSNGTYIIDVPSGVNPQSYALQVKDPRGILVAASSFSHYTGTLAFNTSFSETDNYIVSNNSAVDGIPDIGTHSNFAAQKSAPDAAFDTLSEAFTGFQSQDYYPTSYSLIGSTTLVSGDLTNLSATDGVSMSFRSYGSAEQTCEVEFSGSSNTYNLNSLLYSINSSSSMAGVNMTYQLYDYQAAQYPTSGDGYINVALGTSSQIDEQSIYSNPTHFRDSIGAWKLKFKAVMPTSSSFEISIDLARYRTISPKYVLNAQEQWTNVIYGSLHPMLCIKTGTLATENLAVDAWHGGTWNTVINSLVSNAWNNISVSQYTDSSTFTIRLRGANNGIGQTSQSSWGIDSVLLRPQSSQSLFLSQQNPASTVAVELLQNGTMIWLGQNLQLTTQTIPILPVPVKAFHISETIDGVNQQVPFQIEDWASSYTVPLGLTNNATVFGNRQMIVFLLNTHVSDFTVWWEGSDTATQTPLAYSSSYFSGDNPSGHRVTNGKLSLSFSTDSKFTVTSTVGSTTSTASYMRINNQASTYGAGEAYVIHNGVIRDIIQQESEWSNGITNCPNLYANIVLTLPANATYYTYQLDFKFMTSQQTRTITDLNPVSVSSNVGQLLTENGTILGTPVVVAGTQTLSNSTGTWAHHWSQFSDGTNGAGIMFTDQANAMLYTFDTPTPCKGALVTNAAAHSISLLPVTLNPVSFQNSLDVTWCGVVATFDASGLPIYNASGQPGLWILAELPPTITFTVGN